MRTHLDGLQLAAAAALAAEAPTEQVVLDENSTAHAINEAADEVQAISRNVEELGLAAATMESYVVNFFKAIPDSEWNTRTSRQFQLGMGALLGTMNYSLESHEYCVSMEDSAATMTAAENLNKTKEKSEGLLRRVWEALKRVIAQFIESIKKFFGRFKNGLSMLKAKVTRNRAAILKTKGSGVVDDPAPWTSVPAWAKYLQVGKEHVMPSQALGYVDKVDHQVREWIDVHIRAGEAVMRAAATHTADTHGANTAHLLSTPYPGKAIPPSMDWPGAVVVTLAPVEGNGPLTFGNMRLKKKDSDVENTTIPHVMTLEESTAVTEHVDHSIDVMRKLADYYTLSLDKLWKNSAQLKLDGLDATAPQIMGHLLAQMSSVTGTLFRVVYDVQAHALDHSLASSEKRFDHAMKK